MTGVLYKIDWSRNSPSVSLLWLVGGFHTWVGFPKGPVIGLFILRDSSHCEKNLLSTRRWSQSSILAGS